LASGGGSNLQALLDHGSETWQVALVVSDRPGAGALERAARAGVAQAVVASVAADPEGSEVRLLSALAEQDVDAVVLAGYLKLVPAGVVRRYAGRIVNIHPELLPAFGGKGMYGIHVHRAVVQAGVRVTGATVHLVDEVYDRGRILAQWPVPVRSGDTPEDVAARVLLVEHQLYPRVVDHLAAAWRAGLPPEPVEESGDVFRLVPSGESS
jgi:formyltetrahydrofolate-dependent phosphoribosylglycinamide formyltransferase